MTFPRSLQRWSLTAIATAALLGPTAFALVDASAAPRQLTRREKVLRKIPTDPTILINVSRRDLPTSTDILNLGRRSTQALERCLADNGNAGVRSECARILGALGDPTSLPSLRAATADWDPSVRMATVEALAAIPHPDSHTALAKLFSRNDESTWLRHRVLGALGRIGNQRSVQLLRRVARQKPKKLDGGKSTEPDFRAAAFQALWESRHLMARGTLIGDVTAALKSDKDPLVLEATHAAAELRASAHVRPLIPLIESRNEEIRNKAVYALGKIGDRAAISALKKALPRVREARMLNNIAFALDRLDRSVFEPMIRRLIQHKQVVIRLNAAYVLGDVTAPNSVPLLAKALKDPSDLVKASAIAALGRSGQKAARSPIETMTTSSNPSLRQEALFALHRLSNGQLKERLHAQLFASDWAKDPRRRGLRRRAAIALGNGGDLRVRRYLIHCLESYRCSSRQIDDYLKHDKSPAVTRRLLLLWAQGRGELGELIATRRPKGATPLARAGIQAAKASGNDGTLERRVDFAGALGASEAAAELKPLLKERATWLRLHVAVALLRLGELEAKTPVLSAFESFPTAWLPGLSRLVARVDDEKARQALKPKLEALQKSPDHTQALAAAAVLLAWKPEAAIFRFLDGLAASSPAERLLAEQYLARQRDRTLTFVLRRALAREKRPFVKDRLRSLVDSR